MYDLILKGGRVVDPASSIDGILDVGFADGKVAAVGANLECVEAGEVKDVTGCVVTPGLIDFHTHVYWGGTSLGVDSERIARRSGTTTFVDAGSAGAGNLPGFRAHVIERVAPRILAYVNISFAGIFGFSKNVMVGECGDMRLVHPHECLAAAKDNLDIVVGIKARIGAKAGGMSGIAPLHLAIEVADKLGLPVMAHIDNAPPNQKEVLEILRPGDILTHCFRPWPNAPIDGQRNIRAEVLAARDRGVVFDIGHGQGGFSFDSCRAMFDEGIFPDVISSDVHVLCVDGPAHDVLAVMSKFMALGMNLTDVVRCVTLNPAQAMRRPELGSLAVGTPGDATILELRDEPVRHVDVSGETLTADTRLAARGVVIGGHWWANGDAPEPRS
ncbi:amidohydrolase/deacetylase family metallohydrolase [Acuticoccus sediminis]|uniref:Amidohydrolase/deacetylase family metallohydrolase n=1 Tax=Acuticoccus sediminis TaxID=2184697 RepID=A0A8B2NYE4_9HYPH|nr:amidohydrolase/deacetylase family metallohydrolase [Acuticoccus sediminis]RAI02382.1 amidohydrolase/deacetylase family metallohydrolase [Acuticoccus sediminis]